MATAPTPISAAPTAPDRADRATFSARGTAWADYQKTTLVPGINAIATNVYDNAVEAAQKATLAATSATDAQSAATSAAATAGATKWVSGSYADGVAVWSPTDGQTYRRKAPGGASPTDPALDYANWGDPLGSPATLSGKVLKAPKYTRDDDGTISGGTWAIDYNNGPVIKAQAGAAITSITMANWPASGTEGHLRLRLVNFGAYTITFPAWNWVKSDLTTTTTFADLSLTLPSAGTAIIDLISDDGGATITATVLRG